MSAYLSFRSQFAKIGDSERLFLMQRVRHWLNFEYVKKNELDIRFIKHLNVSHCLWDEFWWRRLREYSKTPAFAALKNALLKN